MDTELSGTLSWSGEGVGTTKEGFLRELGERVPDLPAEQVAVEVFGAMEERLSGGVVRELLDELPRDLREYLVLHDGAKDVREGGAAQDKEAFYMRVAERLDLDPDEVRRVLHGFFAALHGQITESIARNVASELPKELSGTWLAARRVANRPA